MRARGDISIVTNYEVKRNAPFDARMLAGIKADLTDPTQWESPITMYAGMIVAVVEDEVESNNGVYILKRLPFVKEENWEKLADTNSFTDFQTQIEADLTNYVSKEEATEFVKMVEEKGKGKIKLTYNRNGAEHTVTLTKKTVTLDSVFSEVINKDNAKIGYIRVSIFASNTDKQFAKHLSKLEEKNIDSLIIDLRANSGGHLSAATNMISEFLDSSHVIYQIKVKDEITKTYSNGHKTKDYKIAILVDNTSASASEIMTSALQEQYKAIVVGVKTYGKGTVQELQNLPNGDQYKFTTKEWLTSKGKTIDGRGIIPDVEVSLDDAYYKEPIDANDNQLQTALNEVVK